VTRRGAARRDPLAAAAASRAGSLADSRESHYREAAPDVLTVSEGKMSALPFPSFLGHFDSWDGGG